MQPNINKPYKLIAEYLMSKPWIKDWILSKQAKNLGVVYNKPTEQDKKTDAARIKWSIELRFREEEL